MRSISGTSDFGKPGVVGRFRTVVPVCIDTLGETWAGFVADGPDAGRSVFITVLNHAPDSLPARPILNCCREAVRIRHPNLLAFLDAAPTEESVGLVSEYMQGEPLSTLLSAASAQRVPIAPGVALTIMRDAVETLSRLRSAHPESFSHGGLCPETIFVASFGETILRNSGLQSAALKMVGFRKHPVSLPYRAPEYLRDPRENEETSDVFSAGVILWEMLAGRPLFGGEDHLRLGRLHNLPADQLQAIEERILTLPIPSLGSVQRPGGTIHPDVIRLVDWCLKREPAARPQTLEVLGRALSSLPRGVLARSTDVAGTVQRLAGATFTRREELLSEATGVSSASSATRPTSSAQNAQGQNASGSKPGAAVDEESTATRLHPEVFDPFDAKTVPRGTAPKKLPVRVLPEAQGYEEEPGPDSRQEEPHPPAVIAIGDRTRDSQTTGGWLFAAIALLAAGAAASYTLLLPGGTASTSQGDPKGDVSVSQDLPEQTPPAGQKPKDLPAQKNAESPSPSAPGAPAEAKAAPSPPKFTNTPPSVPRRTAVPKKSSAPAELYRPKGI